MTMTKESSPWPSDTDEEFKRCLLDERRTNTTIRETGDPTFGYTLCGDKRILVQKNPADALVLVNGRINSGVRLHYAGTWDIGHWFNHYRSYDGKPMYGVCVECAHNVLDAFGDVEGHYR